MSCEKSLSYDSPSALPTEDSGVIESAGARSRSSIVAPRYLEARDFLGGEVGGWDIPGLPVDIIGAATDILWMFAWRYSVSCCSRLLVKMELGH